MFWTTKALVINMSRWGSFAFNHTGVLGPNQTSVLEMLNVAYYFRKEAPLYIFLKRIPNSPLNHINYMNFIFKL